MKALSIDCAVSRLMISAKNDDKIFTSIYDIGMKQSESIVPAIDYALEKVLLSPSELDYTAITLGPGSFTGLRLGISAAKAIELAYNVPVYGISTLTMHAYCFKDFELPVLAAIDANKNKYYANLSDKNKTIMKDGDWDTDIIIKNLKKIKKLIVCGPDANKLKDIIIAQNKKIKILTPKTNIVTAEALFSIAEDMISKNQPGIKDFDGPLYLRASEAEIVKNSKQ